MQKQRLWGRELMLPGWQSVSVHYIFEGRFATALILYPIVPVTDKLKSQIEQHRISRGVQGILTVYLVHFTDHMLQKHYWKSAGERTM